MEYKVADDTEARLRAEDRMGAGAGAIVLADAALALGYPALGSAHPCRELDL